MNNTEESHQDKFETDFHYAIVAGWLIIPAIGVLLAMMTQVVYLTNTGSIPWLLVLVDFIFALFYAFIIYIWIKRKKILPTLMIIVLSINIVQQFYLFSAGSVDSLLYVIVSIIWIAYFIRSKRVKATFVN